MMVINCSGGPGEKMSGHGMAREYGGAPFGTAVVHGGPGAPGELAPVASELSATFGVVEPIQTASTLRGQLQELVTVLEETCEKPVALIGHSWGAMLSFIFTALNPRLVRKLILVSSAVFDEEYAAGITITRLSRLTQEERSTVQDLSRALVDPGNEDRNSTFARIGKFMLKADSFDPLPFEDPVIEYQYDIFESVWTEAEELRSSGGLLELGGIIRCPVVAVHGDYDPHPAEGVRLPLSGVLGDFTFVLLERCGHRPWIERAARDRFYDILRSELAPK
jgi:pimeloyl-ACP methyl ester carboxylesterase